MSAPQLPLGNDQPIWGGGAAVAQPVVVAGVVGVVTPAAFVTPVVGVVTGVVPAPEPAPAPAPDRGPIPDIRADRDLWFSYWCVGVGGGARPRPRPR